MMIPLVVGNVMKVRSRIALAARRSGRDPGSVRLIAVTKSVDSPIARELFAAGVPDFGENRLQAAAPKLEALSDLPIRWHFIGRLQTNKARKVLERFEEIHSLDRLDLLEAIERIPEEQLPKRVRAYLQVNVSGETAKAGVTPEEARRLAERLRASRRVDWVGLMTLAPESEDPEAARPVFAGLRALGERLCDEFGLASVRLSMGMSNDYPVAVEEGATDVRIGGALFEGL